MDGVYLSTNASLIKVQIIQGQKTELSLFPGKISVRSILFENGTKFIAIYDEAFSYSLILDPGRVEETVGKAIIAAFEWNKKQGLESSVFCPLWDDKTNAKYLAKLVQIEESSYKRTDFKPDGPWESM
ncbi:MAG: hypothetical protein ACRCXZ_02755 [Patescibacteria group bacterium]